MKTTINQGVQQIPWHEPKFYGEEIEFVVDALKTRWVSDGKYVSLFEELFSKKISSNYALTVSNGTTALQLALLSLGVKPGDEVIVPGYTFSAPINMVKAIGATPVYADIDSETWCLDTNLIEPKITKKTKAIIPVHIYGNCVDMPQVTKISSHYKLAVIEDTAQALFSKINNKSAGTYGDIGCFSFQATKTITMGEGGALAIKKKSHLKTASLIRNHGMRPEKRYWHECIGYNFRLTNMQAALGVAQLHHCDEIINRKKEIYANYLEHLKGIHGITLQKVCSNVNPVMWSVTIKINGKHANTIRNKLIDYLSEQGIECRSGFYSFDLMPFYQCEKLKVSQEISKTVISLPSSTMLTNSSIEYITNHIKKFWRKHAI